MLEPRSNGNGTNARPSAVPMPAGRVPPHDLDAERSVLGGVLLDHLSLRSLAEVLAPHDFYREAHRKIFAVMLELDEDREPIDRVTVTDRLREQGQLEAVGGASFVELLDTVVPSASNLMYYGTIVHEKAMARRLIEAAQAISSQGYEGRGTFGELLEEANRRIKVVTDDRRQSLMSRVMPLTPGRIQADPPARQYLLRRAVDNVGVVAMGQVGMLAGSGGSGKSTALLQLGIAIATGTTWLGAGTGWAARQGKALLALGEEDEAETQRRTHYACLAAEIIGDELLGLVAQNLLIMPLQGKSVALTTDENLGRGLPRSRFAVELYELLVDAKLKGQPFTFVGLDPLSRFAGPDVETDNAAATRFIQVIETFASPECGSPAVMLIHHNRKRGKDEGPETPASIRGSSALVDGVRWAATIERMKRREGQDTLLQLKVGKSNYAAIPMPLILEQVPNCHGALRVANDLVSPEEKRAAAESLPQDIIDKVFAKIPVDGEGVSKSFIVDVARVNRQHGMQAINILVDAKRVVQVGRGKYVRASVPNGSETTSQNQEKTGSQAPLPLASRREGGPEPISGTTGTKAGTDQFPEPNSERGNGDGK